MHGRASRDRGPFQFLMPIKGALIYDSCMSENKVRAEIIDTVVLGSKFGMKMHLGIDYRIRNTVVEYKKDELIAWRHLGRWRWRYELVDLGNGSTQVIESFDGSYAPAIAQTWLNFRKAYPWTQQAVAKTLVRLKSVAEAE